jgi:WD40 repeat protein
VSGLATRAQVPFAVAIDQRADHALGAHVSVLSVINGQVAAALGDGTVRFMAGGGHDAKSVAVHKGAILCGAGTLDGTSLLTGGDDGRVNCVTVDGASILSEGRKWIDVVTALADRGYAFSAGNVLTIQQSNGRRTEHKMPGPIGGMNRVSPAGLAVAHLGGVTLIDVSDKPKPQARLSWDGLHVAVAVSPDRRFIVTGTYDGALHGWRIADGTDMHMGGYISKPKSLSWSPRGNWLASSGANRAVLWPFEGRNGPMGRQATTLAPRRALVTSVVWHPKFDILAIGYEDGAVVLAQRSNSDVLPVRQPDGSAITEMTFDRSGKIFACGTECGALTVLTLGDAS